MERPRSLYARWRFALKPDSWPKLFAPTLFGHALGAAHLGRVDLEPALAGAVHTFLLLAAVVLLNDYGDRDVDALKRRIYPHSSPKTIPDGVLPPLQVLSVGALAAIGYVVMGFWIAGWAGRPGYGVMSLLSIGLFVMYSLPPVRLNYRGGGELLEMLGVGLALPYMNAYLQGGLGATMPWLPRPAPVLGAVAIMALASAVASGLGDEVSDRRGGKRTFTTRYGNVAARRFIELLMLLAPPALLLAAFSAHVPLLAVLPASGYVLWRWRRMRKLSSDAVTGAFDAQRAYKAELHAAIWRGTEILGGSLVAYRLFLGG